MSLEEELADEIGSDTESIFGEQEHQQTSNETAKAQSFTSEQIKSYIAILSSALGGIDHSSPLRPAPYKLGDEALLCLQDIWKWLRAYDGESKSWEVAVASAECGLISDLVTIICMWEDYSDKIETFSGISKDYDRKVAVSCLKVMDFLLKPIDRTKMTGNQLGNYYILKKQELSYKYLLLSYRQGQVFRAVIKMTLPILSTVSQHRLVADIGLLRLVLRFLKNFLLIEQMENLKQYKRISKANEVGDNLPTGLKLEDIDINACVSCFDRNLVFPFLLTLCSTITEEIDSKIISEWLLEILYLLTKNVRPTTIMNTTDAKQNQTTISSTDSPVPQLSSQGNVLSNLLSKEKELKTNFSKQTSSRHGRFGTLLSLQTENMGRLTVTNAGNIISANKNPISAFDRHKDWKMAQPFKYNMDEEVIFPEVTLLHSTRIVLKTFFGDFIDGALNPLFKILIGKLSSDDIELKNLDNPNWVNQAELQFKHVMLLSWLLEAHRLRAVISDGDYALVGNIISEHSFILINRFCRDAIEAKLYRLQHAGLIAYVQFFQILNAMDKSEVEEYHDTSRLLKERLFHKAENQGALQHMISSAHKRTPQYVDTCVELLDVMMNTFEAFSKEDMRRVVLDKKSRPSKSIKTKEQDLINRFEPADANKLTANEKDELSALAAQLSKERNNSFISIQRRFTTPGIINTYMEYFKRFKDIPDSQLKRALKFLHRLFFKLKHHVVLYRLDFLYLLHTILSDDEGLSRAASVRKHFQEFMLQFMRQFRKSLTMSDSLFLEVLFPLNSRTAITYGHYIETGQRLTKHENTIAVSKRLEIIGEFTLEEKVSIAVASLIDDDKINLVEWISAELEKIVHMRIMMDNPQDDGVFKESPGIQPIILKDSDKTHMRQLVTEPKLRFILNLAGFDLPGDTSEDCVLPVSTSLVTVTTVSEFVVKYKTMAVEFPNGRSASDFLRIIEMVTRDDGMNGLGGRYSGNDQELDEFIARDEESDEEGYMDDILDSLDAADEAHFSVSRGIARSKGSKVKKKKTSASKKGEALPMHEISGDEVSAPSRKQNTHVSSEFIVDSDDDSDEEADAKFFERERRLREFLQKNEGNVDTAKLNEFLREGAISNGANKEKEAQRDPVIETMLETPIGTEVDTVNPSVKKRSGSQLKSPIVKRARVIVEDDEYDEDHNDFESFDFDDQTEADNQHEDKENQEPEDVGLVPTKRRIPKLVFSDDDGDDDE